MRGYIRFALMGVAIWPSLCHTFAQVNSAFTTDVDGWTAPNSASGTILHNASGGNLGGYAYAFPTFTGVSAIFPVYFYFTAPGKFLGNFSSYYNGAITFDLQQAIVSTPVSRPEVIISNGSIFLHYIPSGPFNPVSAPAWSSYVVPLNELSGFWINAGTGGIATQSEFMAVLSNLTIVSIRGRFNAIASPGATGIDNVVMQPVISINTQPTSQIVCDGDIAVLTTSASGNINLGYQWQIENPSVRGGYANLTNSTIYSGVTTSALNINTGGLFGAGNYRCVVTGNNTPSVVTSVVGVAVNTIPAPPTTTGNSACGPSAVTLNASGGSAGQYRWYTVPTGGSPISGETSSSFTSSLISTTTTYYVSIDNGTCESSRASVIATINPVPSAPTALGNTSCIPAAVTLTASGGSAGQYRWYAVPTGGASISGETNSNFTTPVVSVTTTFYVSINNGNCESNRTSVAATIGGPGCTNQPPVINTSSTTTTISGIATFNLLLLISDGDDNLDPSTLTIITPPISNADAQINNGVLTINYIGLTFAGTDRLTIGVCDLVGSCTQQELTIEVDGDVNVYNGISPNGDFQNEIWIIQNIQSLPDTKENKVSLFNRWGDSVFEMTNYDNDSRVFRGISKNRDELPSGIYFYKIEFASGRKTLAGYLTVKK